MDGLTPRLDTLRANPELAGFSRAQLRFLLRNLDEVVVPAGYRVAEAGSFCKQFVVVAGGRLKASGAAGERVVHAGESLGWRAMWERELNDETVVAESEARLLVMGHAQFRAVKGIAARPPAEERPPAA